LKRFAVLGVLLSSGKMPPSGKRMWLRGPAPHAAGPLFEGSFLWKVEFGYVGTP
jgi:hypothetical protein